ncbi:MAG: VOC family protein [Alicyclobacillus sp.]|nr:VOC family protein [Alicyclobacillus sp.]
MPQIRLINIYVSDLERARKWYCDVLGFEIAQDLPPLAMELRHDGITLLLHKAERSARNQFWTDSMITLALATDDIRRDIERFRTMGVEILHDEPQFSPFGDWIAFNDPFGNVLELVQFNE